MTDTFSAFTREELEKLYPKADAHLGEKMQPGEVDSAEGLIATLVDKVRADYQPGSSKRDAHPKAHGCVEATFDIEADLPPELTGGIFKPGASYDAVVRFSNGVPRAQPDIKGDTRGMAIKLFGVKGPKLLKEPDNADVQDIIMISSPAFFIDSAKNYTKFFEAINTGKIWKLATIPFLLGFKGSKQAAKMMMQKIDNPLETRYWSVVPYQLGSGDARQAVKYSARPMGPTKSTIPNNPAPNFLRTAMAKTLSAGSWKMEFMVQLGGAAGLDVENSVNEWPESTAPFKRVGVITIHKQIFDTPERDAYGENQSFNPWRSLEEHRPLGMINRTRNVVYRAISDLRHSMNKTTIPVGMPDEEGDNK